MKKKQSRNGPRLVRAIKQVISYLHEHHGGWYCSASWECRPDNFGEMVFNIAYRADKFDILNRLVNGCIRLLRSFIRADIRWEKPTKIHSISVLLIIIVVLTF